MCSKTKPRHLGTSIAASLIIDQVQSHSHLKRGGMNLKLSTPFNSYSIRSGFCCESRCFLGMLRRAENSSQSSYSRAFPAPKAMLSNSSRQFFPCGKYNSVILRTAAALGTRQLAQILVL
jgi:hypothetical protein